ncbi:hypothetical protein ACFWMQ_15590 [Streptomyces sp. NPDC058372]|uniref:hypothetical protein n=1 Tax=Streptomyces sp. NPDC058372 TaxID=3346464 RepID=UPI00364BE360
MKIRILATGAALAAALAIPAIPATANEAATTAPASPATPDDLGWGSPGSGAAPSPSPTALPNADLGWG